MYKLNHNSTYQNVFIHKIDWTRCLLLLMTLWREEGKLKTTRAFLYLINFDVEQSSAVVSTNGGFFWRPNAYYITKITYCTAPGDGEIW